MNQDASKQPGSVAVVLKRIVSEKMQLFSQSYSICLIPKSSLFSSVSSPEVSVAKSKSEGFSIKCLTSRASTQEILVTNSQARPESAMDRFSSLSATNSSDSETFLLIYAWFILLWLRMASGRRLREV